MAGSGPFETFQVERKREREREADTSILREEYRVKSNIEEEREREREGKFFDRVDLISAGARIKKIPSLPRNFRPPLTNL